MTAKGIFADDKAATSHDFTRKGAIFLGVEAVEGGAYDGDGFARCVCLKGALVGGAVDPKGEATCDMHPTLGEVLGEAFGLVFAVKRCRARADEGDLGIVEERGVADAVEGERRGVEVVKGLGPMVTESGQDGDATALGFVDFFLADIMVEGKKKGIGRFDANASTFFIYFTRRCV
jgi:hypothetical protein